jgi:hypothetical protein
VITVTIETAIANGRCATCRGVIRPGARYRREAAPHDGAEWLARCLHLHCTPEPVRDANGQPTTPAEEIADLRRRLAERGA